MTRLYTFFVFLTSETLGQCYYTAMQAPSPSPYEFKRANAQDATTLTQWIQRYYAYDHIPFNEALILPAIPHLLKNDQEGVAYFVTLNDLTIGYFILTFGFDLEFGGKLAIVTDLFFDEAVRRKGAGHATIQFIQSICLEAGIAVLQLQVETDNHEAQAFYQKSGFKTLTRHSLIRELQKAAP